MSTAHSKRDLNSSIASRMNNHPELALFNDIRCLHKIILWRSARILRATREKWVDLTPVIRDISCGSTILLIKAYHYKMSVQIWVKTPKLTPDKTFEGYSVNLNNAEMRIERYAFTPYEPAFTRERRVPKGEILAIDQGSNQEKKFLSGIKDFIKEVVPATLNFLKYNSFTQRFKDDISCLIRNFAVRASNITGDKETMKAGFQGKFFGALIASDVLARWISIPAAIGLQLATGNPWIGMASHLVLSYLTGAVSFQGFWAMQNRGLYRSNEKGPVKAFLDMQKDLIPAHIQAAKLAGKIYCVTIPIYTGLTALVDSLSAEAVPVAILARALLTPAAGILFVKWMGDFHERMAAKLAEREYAQKQDAEAPSLNGFGRLIKRFAPGLLKSAGIEL